MVGRAQVLGIVVALATALLGLEGLPHSLLGLRSRVTSRQAGQATRQISRKRTADWGAGGASQRRTHRAERGRENGVLLALAT